MRKTIVITGCSSGFGRHASEQFARLGHRVYAGMRDPAGRNAQAASALRALAESAAIDLRVFDVDVTSTASVDRAASAVLAESGAPDVLLNNAGQMFVGLAEAFTAEELANQLDVNLVGVHRMNRAFLPAMRQRGDGVIINLSSTAGRAAVPFNAIYHASKWALEGYSLALRGELATSGIDLVVIEPGPFSTLLFPSMRLPADVDQRTGSYPDIVRQTQAAIDSMFAGLMSNPDTPTDPQLVVDRMLELVAMRAGTRPFRSVVGIDFGVTARNAAVEPFDAGLLEAAGLTDFTRLRVGDK